VPAHFSAVIPDTITIASYNAENFFDCVKNGSEYPEYCPDSANWNINTFSVKRDNIASVITATGAQIVALVEIENENTVNELQNALAKQRNTFQYYAIANNEGHSNTRPVIMSKFPIIYEKSFGVTNTFSHERSMLEAAVYLGHDTLTMFVCHWPSKKAMESKRVEKGLALMNRCEQYALTKDYIVAGDFNENYDEAASFHTARLDDSHGVSALNHVLKTLSSQPRQPLTYTKKTDCINTTMQVHFDPWTELAEQDRCSEMFQGRRETPDHILLPHSMFDSVGLSYVNNSFHAFTWNGRLIKDGVPYRWQMRYTKHGRVHVGEGYSDHLPVVLKLARGAYKSDAVDTRENNKSAHVQGSFEDGVDGFIACTKTIRVERDTAFPKSGRYCLKMSGISKSNCCAVKCLMPLPEGVVGETGKLLLSIRGIGSITIRIGNAKQKKWAYFKGENFAVAKAGKYTDYNFVKWKSIALPLSAIPCKTRELDLEIRTKKNTKLEMWIDDVRIVR